MGTRNLDRIFNPRQVALVGASDKPSDVGYIVFRNLLDARFHGVVYPVTPDREAVQGIQAYPDISSLPKCPDLAVICSALPDIPRQVEACGEAGVPGVLIISHGRYGNQTESTELKREIGDIARKFRGLRILGPNALGIIRPGIGLNASLTGSMPKPGHLALICQSGALANAILDRAVQKGIGLSHFVSAGEMLDVSFGDFIDYLGMDYSTRAIILYVQSIDRSREFMSAARAFAKTKPIVAYKAGRFNASAQAVALHSGALVVEDAVYEAAFQRAGVVRALELDDIFDIAELLACQRLPQGARLAIVSNAGGAAIVAADALLAHQGTLAELTEKTMTQLGEALPLCNIRGNPVDLTDEAPPQFFSDAIRIVLTDRGVDAVLVLLTPQVMTNPKATAIQLQDVAKGAHKPVLAAWMGGLKVRKGIRILNRAGLPTHASPEHAVRAFMHLVTYTRNLKNLYETPRDIPINFPLDRRRRHQNLDRLAGEEHQYMTDYQTKRLLQAYGIPVCETHEAFSGREAVKVARKIGKAVALKVLTTPQIVHKSDVGGVALNLQNARQIRQAYDYLMESVAARRPDVKIEGVTVQEMVEDQRGFEMILGAKKDPTFGAVIMTGLGGLATGIFQDRALGLPPINERLAWNMLESLRSWPLLQGHRGQPGVDLDRVIEILMRFSYLVADYPEFLEIDINPLLVTQTDVIALDTVTLLDTQFQKHNYKPYQHLAIRPYPDEYIKQFILKDGTPVTLSPIRPEDEPLWNKMLSNTSPESLRFRFRTMLKSITHEMATRHCFIDYEREITIVAGVEVDGRRKLVGEGNLFSELDRSVAEFAVVVTDEWQNRGLGGLLLDYCIKIAGTMGVNRIVAETEPRNHKMLVVFRKRGFKQKFDIENDVVYLEKSLEEDSDNLG